MFRNYYLEGSLYAFYEANGSIGISCLGEGLWKSGNCGSLISSLLADIDL